MYYETVNTARLRRLASAGPDGAEDYQEFGTELFSPELNTKHPYLLCEIVKEKNTGREKSFAEPRFLVGGGLKGGKTTFKHYHECSYQKKGGK